MTFQEYIDTLMFWGGIIVVVWIALTFWDQAIEDRRNKR